MRFPDDLVGLRALLTGGSSGIGAAAARVLSGAGATVCLQYNTGCAAADALVAELRGAGGVAHAVQADLTDRAAPSALVAAALDHMGGIDCLINNAGAIFRSSLADLDETVLDRVFDLNLRSVLRLTAAAHPHLAASSRASIINLGSVAGRHGGVFRSGLYAAAKASVHSVTRAMAREFAAQGIRVNAVAPGMIVTPFHAETAPETLEAIRQTIPMARLGTPEDCAWTFAFLASPAMSGYITGQIIDINGGQLMP